MTLDLCPIIIVDLEGAQVSLIEKRGTKRIRFQMGIYPPLLEPGRLLYLPAVRYYVLIGVMSVGM